MIKLGKRILACCLVFMVVCLTIGCRAKISVNQNDMGISAAAVENVGESPPEETPDLNLLMPESEEETIIQETIQETEGESEPKMKAVSEEDPETEPETESEAETETESETESEAETETESETESEAETETESETELDSEAESETEESFSDLEFMPFMMTAQYSVNASGADINSSVPSLGVPEHHKTIAKIKTADASEVAAENNYRLSLDVKGSVGEAVPMDVLLIVDKSDSISTTLQRNINSAIQILYQELKKADANISVSVVEFSGPSEWNSGLDNPDASVALDWTPVKTGTMYQLGARDGGTNWQAGVRLGELQFQKRPVENNRYTVFLTDGLPIAFYSDADSNNPYHTAWDKDTNAGTSYNKAVAEWGKSERLRTSMAYVVDATTGSSKNATCTAFAKAISGSVNNCLKGNSSQTLTESFKKIADSITKPAYTNVYIQDTLSEYAEFDETNLDLKVYAGGALMSEDAYSVALDVENKTIRVDFLGGAQLGKDVVYKIEYNIIPSQRAYEVYETEGIYNAVGDAGTDSPGNATSAGMAGFRCNSSAIVGYDVNDYINNTAQYNHPVIQVEVFPESALPECGGPGIALFTISGALIILLALLLYIRHRIKFV